MIRFSLRCDEDHAFESWFASNAAFDSLQSAGGIECPHCGSSTVEKALMAPSLGAGTRKNQPEILPPEKGMMAVPVEAKVRAALRQLRQVVEENCDYVGDRFADEAIAMHRGESEERGIYGEATIEESERLADEGIEVSAIPWLPKSDA